MLFIRLLSRFAGAYGLPAFQAWTVSMGKFEFRARNWGPACAGRKEGTEREKKAT